MCLVGVEDEDSSRREEESHHSEDSRGYFMPSGAISSPLEK